MPTDRPRMSKPPVIFSPRWFRIAWMIVREGIAYRRSMRQR